jgi:hypothetical protein
MKDTGAFQSAVFPMEAGTTFAAMGDVRVRRHRNMAAMSACSIRGAEDSWRHSLLTCAVTRSVWALADEGIVEHMSMNGIPRRNCGCLQ